MIRTFLDMIQDTIDTSFHKGYPRAQRFSSQMLSITLARSSKLRARVISSTVLQPQNDQAIVPSLPSQVAVRLSV